jgi:two-component system LytT family response regulator
MIRAIIIDDEPKAIDLLSLYAHRINDLTIIESFRDPVKAIGFMETHSIDLVFLDINMPKIKGMSVARIIDHKSLIIFTTAYSEYAVESYDVGAIDYLLKPISFDRFYRSIDKVRQHEATIKTNQHFILIKSGSTSHRMEVKRIFYLEKDGNYIFYHTDSERIMARESTSEALEKLPDQFARVHKSYIVNINHVHQFTNEYITINDRQIPIGESFRKETINTLLGNINST